MDRELTGELDWLYSTQLFGIKLGLDNTVALLEKFDAMPRQGVRIIHVAGTNGKGSTCAMIEALARAAGLETGLFTSPHLVSFSERIRVNGAEIEDAELLALLKDIRRLAESCEQAPTFFELAFVLAMKYFAFKEVGLIILETGLGGRLDATNSVRKDVAVLTPIAMDHQQYLGNTLGDIAMEKAGIIEPGKPVASAPQEKQAYEVICRTAHDRNSPLVYVETPSSVPVPALRGEHQRMNAALAMEALRQINALPGDSQIAEALSHVVWQGRFELVASHNLILDGAHNPHAAQALVSTWKECYGEARTTVVFAASADKSIGEVIRLLDPIAGRWDLVPCSSPRILPVSEMKDLVESVSNKPIFCHQSIQDAIVGHNHSGTPLLVTGSLFLIGDVKALLLSKSHQATLQ